MAARGTPVDDQAMARVLGSVARMVVPGALVLLTAVALAFPENRGRVLLEMAGVLAIGLGIHLSLRASRARLAALVGLGGLLAFITVVSATAGGIRGPVWPGYLLAIVLATLVLGERAGWVTTALSAAALGTMALLDELGWLPAPVVHHTPLTHLGVSLVLALGVVLALIYFARAVRTAADAARKEAEERQRTEVALRKAQKSEAIATLARGVAHDFNNLLAAIMGNAQALQAELPNGDARAATAEILQASRRGREVVRQLLTFSASRERAAEVVRVDAVGREVFSLLRASTPAAIDLRAEGGTLCVVADPTQVHQALLNVATNAVQALGPGPGQVTLRVQSREVAPGEAGRGAVAPGRYVCASVTDTGPGMSPDVVSRAFDPFFTTKPHGEGTGLGLAVVQGILKGLGGSVTVDTVPGHGATFSLWFPEAPTAELPALTPPPGTSQPVPELPAGLRVLLVDDDPGVAVAAARLLQRRGCRVTVLGGPDAAAVACRLAPAPLDVAVLDLAMPGHDGLAVLATLRDARPDLPAVLVSGDLEAADPVRLSALRPVVRLAKPFSAEALERAVGTALVRSARPPVAPPGPAS